MRGAASAAPFRGVKEDMFKLFANERSFIHTEEEGMGWGGLEAFYERSHRVHSPAPEQTTNCSQECTLALQTLS